LTVALILQSHVVTGLKAIFFSISKSGVGKLDNFRVFWGYFEGF